MLSNKRKSLKVGLNKPKLHLIQLIVPFGGSKANLILKSYILFVWSFATPLKRTAEEYRDSTQSKWSVHMIVRKRNMNLYSSRSFSQGSLDHPVAAAGNRTDRNLLLQIL